MSNWYKLDENNNPVKAKDIEDYMDWDDENIDRIRVMQQTIDGVTISTVFLGLDHSYTKDNTKPLLWETMIFEGKYDQYQERYHSFNDAVDGHFKALDLVIKNK